MNISAQKISNTSLAAELTELLEVVDPSSVGDVILKRAFDHRATDVHLDPTPVGLRVRFRVDGLLQDILPLPDNVATNVISRIKIMSGMDITERRTPQDGHIASSNFDGIAHNVRVSSLSTVHGERLVLRLMPDPEEFVDPTQLGFFEDQLAVVECFLQSPSGLVLVVGPVGSGKSTTVYSLLRKLNSPHQCLVTIEDPVERLLPGANQIQIDNKTGLTFGVALRGVLRQDPNVMAIGEIRDAETAAIACRAAMTGVQVFSTLHAGSSASAIEMLKQFGVPNLVISEALRGVISQRLIRRVSLEDREEFLPDDDQVRRYDLSPGQPIVRGIATSKNFQTGYIGRVAVFETLNVSPAVRDAISDNISAKELRQLALDDGMQSLSHSARRHVQEHTTSLEELHRVILDSQLHI